MAGKMRKDPWQLVKGGQFQQAVVEYTRLYEEKGQPFYLHNRGLAYLNLDDYASALADFERGLAVSDPNLMSDSDLIDPGICYWYLDQPARALNLWRRTLETPYTDAAGGVLPPLLLLYAAERLHDPTLSQEMLCELNQRDQFRLGNWPGAVVPFVLGETDLADLEQAIHAVRSEILETRWRCQADFYRALRAWRERDRPGFQAGMIRCASSSNGFLEFEFYLARWEVERQFPDPAFPQAHI